MQDALRGYSRAMYSNWLWHKPLQLLVDAGEGLQIALGSNVFSPSVLVISHGHSDHVLGLPGLLAARKFGKGAVDKPLNIVYPEGSVGVQAVREYLGRAYAGVVFPLNWIAAVPGTSVPLGKNKAIEAISVRHTSNEVALGYRVIEPRRRLKPAFASLPQADIEAAARHGNRDDLLEDVRHIVFAHSGDAMPIDPALVKDADVLVHDATFLNEPDRREPIHATTEEAPRGLAYAVGRGLRGEPTIPASYAVSRSNSSVAAYWRSYVPGLSWRRTPASASALSAASVCCWLTPIAARAVGAESTGRAGSSVMSLLAADPALGRPARSRHSACSPATCSASSMDISAAWAAALANDPIQSATRPSRNAISPST